MIFIIDLPFNINRVHTQLYADDALLHQAHQHKQEASLSPLQEAVTSAENWAISWRGCFDYAKTKMMTSSTNIQTDMLRIETEAIDVSRVQNILALFSLGFLTSMSTSMNFFSKQLHMQG